MAVTGKKFQKSIQLKETTEAATKEGEIRNDSSAKKLKVYIEGAEREIVTKDQTQELENKTIDATSATGTNTIVMDAENVTYDNATSGLAAVDVQDAIDEIDSDLDAHIADTVDAHDASAISVTPAGNLASTEVQAALQELQGDINTLNTTSSSIQDDIDDLVTLSGVPVNSTNLGTFTGTTITDNQTVKAALQDLETKVETKVGTTDVATLTNKTIDADNNTITNLEHGAEVDDPASGVHGVTGNIVGTTDTQTLTNKTIDADNNTISNLEHGVEVDDPASGVHGVTGSIVGTSDSQVLTNKDIDGGTASNTSRLTLPSNTKANLDGLTRKEGTLVYATDEDTVYYDDGTNLLPVGSGSGSGSYNYIENSQANVDTSGWTVYANTSAGVRPDDFGGTPNGSFTFTRSTSTPLVGDASFLLTKDAANRQGHGVYYQFTAEEGHKTLKNLFRMIADTSNANIADGDLAVYLVGSDDSFASDFLIIEPNNPDILAGVPQIFKQLQFNAAKDVYRLCIHVKSTNASAYTAKFDDIILGPHEVATGVMISDPKEFTPTGTFTTNATYSGYNHVVGKYAYFDYKISLSGAPNAATLNFDIPSNFIVDEDYILDATNIGSIIGTGILENQGVFRYQIVATYNKTLGTIQPVVVQDDASGYSKYVGITNLVPFSLGASDSVTLTAKVPILGLSSNTVSSEDFGGREIIVYGSGNSGAAITASTEPIDFTLVTDNTGSWSQTGPNGTDTFTAPERGSYSVSGMLQVTASSSTTIRPYVNDININQYIGRFDNEVVTLFSGVITLNKGDQLTLRLGSGATLSNTLGSNHIHIQKLASPQTILETETVAGRFVSSSGQSVTTGNNVIYETIVYDTHGTYNSSTGNYTIPLSGIYTISGKVRNTNSVVKAIDIEVNGTTVEQMRFVTANTDSIEVCCGAILLNKNDVVSIVSSQVSSITLSASTFQNIFSIARIK